MGKTARIIAHSACDMKIIYQPQSVADNCPSSASIKHQRFDRL